jgi:uncharacterized protein
MPSKRRKPARSLGKRVTIPMRDDGTLRLIAIADTHGHPHPKSAELVASLEPDAILHAGDIGDLAVLDTFARIAPLTAVRGNIDVHAPHLPDSVAIDIASGSATALTLLLLHIAVFGPKIRADAARLARDVGATLVVCGHSHVPFIGRDRGLAVINAGSIGPRRFHLPIVFGVVDVRPSGITLHHVDCETGERWEPPPLRLGARQDPAAG